LAPSDVDEIEAIFGRDLEAKDLYADVIEVWDDSESSSHHGKMLEFYAGFYLPGDILAKIDRAAMLNPGSSQPVSGSGFGRLLRQTSLYREAPVRAAKTDFAPSG